MSGRLPLNISLNLNPKHQPPSNNPKTRADLTRGLDPPEAHVCLQSSSLACSSCILPKSFCGINLQLMYAAKAFLWYSPAARVRCQNSFVVLNHSPAAHVRCRNFLVVFPRYLQLMYAAKVSFVVDMHSSTVLQCQWS